jgi:hypothetical protein
VRDGDKLGGMEKPPIDFREQSLLDCLEGDKEPGDEKLLIPTKLVRSAKVEWPDFDLIDEVSMKCSLSSPLGSFLDDWELRNGALTPEELARARDDMRSQANSGDMKRSRSQHAPDDGPLSAARVRQIEAAVPQKLPVFRGKGELLPGIDPTSNRSMLDAADTEEDVDFDK